MQAKLIGEKIINGEDLISHEPFYGFQVTECVMLKRKLQLPCPRGLHHRVKSGKSKDEVIEFFYDTSFSNSYHRLLPRSLVRSVILWSK